MADNKPEKDENKELAWEEIKREHIVKDEWIDFRKSTYRFPDGRVFEPYYSYSRRDYVVIVAQDGEGKYLFCEWPRRDPHPPSDSSAPVPAGASRVSPSDGRSLSSRKPS